MKKRKQIIENALLIINAGSGLKTIADLLFSAKDFVLANWSIIVWTVSLLISISVWIYFAYKEKRSPKPFQNAATKKQKFIKYHPYIYLLFTIIIGFLLYDNYFQPDSNKVAGTTTIEESYIESKAGIAIDDKNSNIYIPSGVEYMWVFLQSKDDNDPTCERILPISVNSYITPQEFKNEFYTYMEKAIEKNMKLIVTAEIPNDIWVDRQIKIKGYKTQRAIYTCNGDKDWGTEIIPE